MSTPFADLAGLLGQATVGLLADATAVFDTESVDGVFDDPAVTLGVGAIGAAERLPSFVCQTLDVPTGVEIGTHLTIKGRAYRVAERDDLSTLGQTRLDLEHA